MKSQIVIITEARDGLGAAAKRLSAKGHRLVSVGRSPRQTETVGREFETGFQPEDFAELNEVRRLAHQLMEHHPCIDLPTDNIGARFDKKRRASENRHGQAFQVSYCAPILEAVGSHGQRHPPQPPPFPTP